MRQYVKPGDEGLAIPRYVGKKPRRRRDDWKLDAVAKLAPQELDIMPEDPIRRQIEGEIRASGLPYLTFEDADVGWLKRLAPTNHHAARILEAIKDLSDFVVWRPAPGRPYSLCLLLELKRRGRGGRPGQRDFAAKTNGVIAGGYSAAHDALDGFLSAPAP